MLSKRLPRIIFSLLMLQFILGMLANLYQKIPEGMQRYDVYYSVGFIALHSLVGVALLLFSIVLLVKIRRRHVSSEAMRLAVGGLISIVIAYVGGILFVETGNDIFSLIMALGFIGALQLYAQLAFGAALVPRKE